MEVETLPGPSMDSWEMYVVLHSAVTTPHLIIPFFVAGSGKSVLWWVVIGYHDPYRLNH